MAYVLAAAGVAGVLWWFSRRTADEMNDKPKPDKSESDTNFTSVGGYGDIKEVGDVVDQPGMFISEERMVGLDGAPYRYVMMRNGHKYKTYNMETPRIA